MNKRILVITRNSWNDSNSTGNTATNLFSQWNKNYIANLFCRAEAPNNEICNKYYRITESDLIGGILKNKEVGTSGSYEKFTQKINNTDITYLKREKKLYDYFRNNRWQIFLWARELLWASKKWKNRSLEEFLKEFNPEIIYMPIHDCLYMHTLLHYIKSVTNAKVVLFTGDDMYSLKQFSTSLLYWINKFLLRRSIRKSINMADVCYCMSDIQISELYKEFGDKFKILRKVIKYKEKNTKVIKDYNVINIVYTGNILLGRWKTLAEIGKIIHEFNKEKIKIKFDIYSTNKLTSKMKKKLNIGEEVIFRGPIESSRVNEVQKNADIVVHVESFKLKYKLQTRLSFSTKLVDYFQNQKCIFAVGWKKANSIDYLIKNNAAIVATNSKMIKDKISWIIENKMIIKEYEQKSWECGIKNHLLEDVQNELYEDFSRL